MPEDNKRETGVRLYKFDTRKGPEAEFSQEAAENEKPKGGFGLTEPVDQTEAETRRLEGVDPGAKPSEKAPSGKKLSHKG